MKQENKDIREGTEEESLNTKEAVAVTSGIDTEVLVEESSEQSEEALQVSTDVEGLFSIYRKEKVALASSSKSTHFLRPRALSDQLTKPCNKYFGTIAGAKCLQRAKQLVADGASYGLGGGALTFKIIKAIEQLLYEISETYFTEKQLKGADTQRAIYLLGSNTENPSAEKINERHAKFTGAPIDSPNPSIITTPYAFTKIVKGGGNQSTTDINGIIDELNRLEKEKRVIVNKGLVAYTRPLREVSLYTHEETGQTILVIVLSPMFAQMIGEKYVKERKDILKLLKGVSKDMTLTLYELLIQKYSYGNPYYHISPKALYEQIAQLSSYKGKPKRVKEDYNYSIEVMKRIRLIKDYSENSTEIKFIFNRNHISEEFNYYPETRFPIIKREMGKALYEYGNYF